MKRAIIALLVTVVMLTAVIAPISAAKAPENTVQPRWQYTMTVDCSMGFELDCGTAYSSVVAYFDSTKIVTDIYIYREVGDAWEYIAEAHETLNDFTSATTCDFPKIYGATYRADYTFTVYCGSSCETICRTIYGTNNYNG